MGFYLKFCATNFFMEIQHNNFCMIALRVRLNFTYVLEVVVHRWKGFISFLCIRIQFSLYTPVIPAMFYMFTGLARCSVDPEISCSAHKLTRTSWVIKKKKRVLTIYSFVTPSIIITIYYSFMASYLIFHIY